MLCNITDDKKNVFRLNTLWYNGSWLVPGEKITTGRIRKICMVLPCSPTRKDGVIVLNAMILNEARIAGMDAVLHNLANTQD